MNQEKLRKYIEGTLSSTEKKDIVHWINESKEHMQEYMSMRRLYDLLIWNEDSVKAKSKLSTKRDFVVEVLKIAAVVILVFSLTYYLFIPNDLISQKQTIYVPAGQRARITLIDGTEVWLNAKSSLTFTSQFTSDNREVHLNGEGYFKVTPNKEKPFRVVTSKYNIKVLGTELNVLAYDNTSIFETALIKGAVDIESNGNRLISLKPETKVILSKDGLKVLSIKHHNYFLWKDGIISFENENLEALMKKLELYYDIKIQIKSQKISTKRFTGKFRTKDGVEHVLRVLQLSIDFIYEKDEQNNIITIR